MTQGNEDSWPLPADDVLGSPFYLGIEEGVRQWVYRLRNVGINTECSCHHEGYIQCQSLDPTTEINRIKTVMLEHGVEDFSIEMMVKGCALQTIEIRSPAFVGSVEGQKVHEPPHVCRTKDEFPVEGDHTQFGE